MSPVQTPSLSRANIVAPKTRRSLWPSGIFVSVLILSLGWWFLLLPQWRTLKALPTIEGFDVTKKSVEDELVNLNALVNEYNKLVATDHTRLDLALPRGQDIPNLLAQFEGIANRTNFTISDIGFSAAKATPEEQQLAEASSQPANTSSAKDLKINLVIEGGDYNDLKEFISLTEDSQILLKLISLTFTTKSAGRSGISYTLNFATAYIP